MTIDQVLLGITLIVGSWLLYALLIRGRLSDQRAVRLINEGALIVDVRNSEEFIEVHYPGAISIPVLHLMVSLRSLNLSKQSVILCYCKSGGRSAIATTLFRNAGYKHAYNLGSLKRAQRISQTVT